MSNKYTMDKLDEAFWRGTNRDNFSFYVTNGRARLIDSNNDVVAKIDCKKFLCKVHSFGFCWQYVIITRDGTEARYLNQEDFFANFPKDVRLIILPDNTRPTINFSPFYGGSARDYSSGPATMGF